MRPPEGVSEDSEYATPVRRGRARYLVAAVVLLVLLAAFLLPLINIGRYHRSIADSLTRSLGHTVHLGSVNLEIFPLPGLAIHDLTVEEDPSFGAEPLLRAPSVTVFLRLSSLWRERLEVSRINLDDASVNLARDSAGHWNFASLLLQASRTASAPTAQRRPGSAPRFPYIEFRSARINFKNGAEKKAFSFLNADASVWLADPNQWQIRLEAQPARTDLDLDLEDTGTMRLEGSVTRAPALDQLPLDLHAEWTGAELGQVSRLILGSDSDWRGDLRAEADVTGDMRNLQIRSRLRVANVHRLEFTPINEFSIDARCQALYHHPQESLDSLTCLLPTGDGHLLLTGSVAGLPHPEPNLNLEINHTPVSFAVAVIGLLRRTLPTDLDAAGTINGQFHWSPQAPLTGHAVADTVAIRFAGIDHPFTFAALNFATPSAETSTPSSPSRSRRTALRASTLRHGKTAKSAPVVPANTILLEPAPFAAGAPAPMQVSGQFSRSGFTLHFTGESDLARMQPLARDLAQLHALTSLAPKGTAQSDFTFAGPWMPDSGTLLAPTPAEASITGAAIEGSTRLQHAELRPAWLPEPIEIAAATLQFNNGNVTWSNADVSINGIAAKGSASYSAVCASPAGCPAQINLDFPTLDAAALQSAILGAGRHGELLEAILSRVERPAPPWPALSGTIHAGTLTLGKLKLSNARASISVQDNRLNILSLDAAALGGSAHATGSIEPAADGPKYALDLTWTGVKLQQLAALFPEDGSAEAWGTGSIDGQMSLNLHGYSNLAATATGDFRWLLSGSWSATPLLITAPSAASRHASSKSTPWAAAGTIANQSLTLTKGPAQGTISFDRALNLTWASSGQIPIHLTGTLAHPSVSEPAPSSPTKRPRNPRGN